MSKEKNALFCPLQEVAKALERKWSLQVIFVIGNFKNIRFSRLQKELRYISPKTLSDTLVKLEKDWLIKKSLNSGSSQKIKYRLTKDGMSAYPIITDMLLWAMSRKKSVVKSCVCTLKPKRVP